MHHVLPPPRTLAQDRSTRRRGATLILVMTSLVMLMSMAALTVDVGMMYRARADLQVSADAIAMAAAWELLDRDRLTGSPSMSDDLYMARLVADEYAGLNPVLNSGFSLGSSDVVIGYLNDPMDMTETLSFVDPDDFNSVQVIARRDTVSNGPIDLFFAPVFGRTTAEVTASATATFKNGVVGYSVPPGGANASVLPLALHIDAWNGLMNGTWSLGDNWAYEPATGDVTAGADNIQELNLFPGNGLAQLPPGNFGTVDLGSSNNSTADLSRQITDGLNSDDLAALGGELVLGEDGTLLLNGDTGLSAAIKDDLMAIIGMPRAIPLFDQVSGPGNNAMFRIVGFAGIQIVEVKLTGPMNAKRVVIQPAFVVDPTAITGPGGPAFGDFVYQPVKLVR